MTRSCFLSLVLAALSACGSKNTAASVDANGPETGPEPDATCPAIHFMPTSVTPSIGLLLDRSGSMALNFGGVTRYQAMASALVDPNTGVVKQFEAKAYFGATLYTTSGDTCPRLREVERSLNNYTAIANLINANSTPDPGGLTPTSSSIRAMVAAFAANPPPAGSPPLIVLATDGLPNGCGDSTQASVAAAAASYAAGIPLFVLAINETSEHFQDLANAGAGVQPGQPNAPYFIGNNPQDLVTAFNSIIGGAISCDLTITGGTVDTAAGALGTVVLNGQPLVYGVDWILVDGTTIQLTGAACTELKSTPTPTVDASFPCGSVLL